MFLPFSAIILFNKFNCFVSNFSNREPIIFWWQGSLKFSATIEFQYQLISFDALSHSDFSTPFFPSVLLF